MSDGVPGRSASRLHHCTRRMARRAGVVMDDERQLFTQWLFDHSLELTAIGVSRSDMMWAAWQAALAQRDAQARREEREACAHWIRENEMYHDTPDRLTDKELVWNTDIAAVVRRMTARGE